MQTVKIIDARIRELSNTTSDLLVGIKCLDIQEIERAARILKEQASKYSAQSFAITAQKIEESAASGDIDTVIFLVTELNEQLLLSSEFMQENQ